MRQIIHRSILLGTTALLIFSCASFRLSQHVSRKIEWQKKEHVTLRELRIYPSEYYPTYEKMIVEAFRFAFLKTGQSTKFNYSPSSNTSKQPLFPSTSELQTTPDLLELLDNPDHSQTQKTETKAMASSNSKLEETNSHTNNSKTESNSVYADLFFIINRKDNPSELHTYYSTTVGMILSESDQPQIIAESRIYYDNIEFIDFAHIQLLIDELVNQLVLNSQIENEAK